MAGRSEGKLTGGHVGIVCLSVCPSIKTKETLKGFYEILCCQVLLKCVKTASVLVKP